MIDSQSAIGTRPLAVSFARAAELTSLSKNSLRRYARSGRLKTTRIGRRRIIPLAGLNELIQNGLDSSSGETR
jgi:excisionase family DNA binding protein